MPSQIRFLGSSLRGVSSNISFNSSTSTLTLNLVDDVRFGDSFSPPAVGTPLFFSLGAFAFGGLLKQHRRTRSISGNPLFEVILEDPREILTGAYVMTGRYSGSVSPVTNIINVYGYMENALGFGGAQSTEAGMPWNLVRSNVHTIVNGSQGPFGGPLTFRGHSYRVDLSAIPGAPNFFRVGGGGLGIGFLQMISEICQAAGGDFYISLLNTSPLLTIKVNFISRHGQPPLGTISKLVNSRSGDVISSDSGIELRNEPVAAFVVGENIHDMFLTRSILPFYGFDVNGIGLAAANLDDRTSFLIDASSIADITGSPYYVSSNIEMRTALHNIGMWSDFIKNNHPARAAILGINNNFIIKVAANLANNQNQIMGPNRMNPNQAVAGGLKKAERVFNLVRDTAQTYYGKQFLVTLPAIQTKSDPDTGLRSYSLEVSQEGGYSTAVAGQLGLSSLQASLLQKEDGRFGSFVQYSNASALEYPQIDPASTVVTTNAIGIPINLFVQVETDPKILFSPQPGVVVKLNNPILVRSNDVFNIDDMVKVFDPALPPNPNIAAMFRRMLAVGGGAVGNVVVGLYGRAVAPALVAVPLKSNIFTYGPWFAYENTGQVVVEQNSNLAPWNYNGFSLLDQAGRAQVFGSITRTYASETGTLQLVGEPIVSIGDVITNGGPNVTNLSISYDADGNISTTYRFEAFTTRFGGNQQFQRSLSTAGKAGNLARKNLFENIKLRNIADNVQAQAANARQEDQRLRLPKAWQGRTPHNCFIADMRADLTAGGQQIANVNLGTFDDVVSSVVGEVYTSQAAMSLQGLLRPFSTKPTDVNLPHYVLPTVSAPSIVVGSLNPFKTGHDIYWHAYGNSYSDIDAIYLGSPQEANIRAIGLRGPLIIVGWGTDIDTNLTPDDEDYLRKGSLWRVGPLDPLWDYNRGVWTVHSRVIGKLDDFVVGGGVSSVLMTIWKDGNPAIGNTGKKLTVYNWFTSTIEANVKVIAEYFPYANKWYIVSADC